MMKKSLSIGSIALFCTLAGCASINNTAPQAIAPMNPTQGHQVSGTVTFTQVEGGVRVDAHLTGLIPGPHGFHIHEKGDCSAPDASSAGAHFNPTKHKHGNPGQGEHHLGDMPALVADDQGNAHLSATLAGLTLTEGETAVVGHSVIVHADPDDYMTQPTGNSGARISCGIISANHPLSSEK